MEEAQGTMTEPKTIGALKEAGYKVISVKQEMRKNLIQKLKEKKNIFELFKKISYYHKELLINDFGHEEESAAKLINKIFKEWKELKKEFIKILDKIKKAWKEEKKSKLELGYFG